MDLFDWEQFNDAENHDVLNLQSFSSADRALDIPSWARHSTTGYSELHATQQATTPDARPRDNRAQPGFGAESNFSDPIIHQQDYLSTLVEHNIFQTTESDLAVSSIGHTDEDLSSYGQAMLAVSKDRPLPTKRNGGGVRLSKESIKTLRAWLQANTHRPYPSDLEKEALAQATGLRKEQISNWLANARRRGKVQHVPFASFDSSVDSIYTVPSATRAVNVPAMTEALGSEDMGPLARWRNSPPGHEGASLSAISNAVATTHTSSYQPLLQHGDNGHIPQNNYGGFSRYRTPSVSSFETGSSGSDLSLFSQSSQNSRQSKSSHRKGTPRRRRKNGFRQVVADPDIVPRPYQCTFCTDSFKTKYDWQRHEKTFHLSLEQWQCAPHGPSQCDVKCIFCGVYDNSPQHLELHNYVSCAEQPLSARLFFRKDHLRQHLRLFHKDCAYHAPTMDTWVTLKYDIASRCGFCSTQLTTWPDRVEHLAAHFKAGKTMRDWTGDHGFAHDIESLIENQIPPALIDVERRTVDPFSASNDGHRMTATLGLDSRLTYSSPQTGWLGIEAHLREYVKQQISNGHVPTDREMQDHARMLVYGHEDDDWNQTRADLPVWLDPFKQRVGLLALPGVPGKNVFVGVEQDVALAMDKVLI